MLPGMGLTFDTLEAVSSSGHSSGSLPARPQGSILFEAPPLFERRGGICEAAVELRTAKPCLRICL
jgi:hypothetical protein